MKDKAKLEILIQDTERKLGELQIKYDKLVEQIAVQADYLEELNEQLESIEYKEDKDESRS